MSPNSTIMIGSDKGVDLREVLAASPYSIIKIKTHQGNMSPNSTIMIWSDIRLTR